MVSKQPSTTTQISKVDLPAWVDAASQDNYKLAQDLASQPFEQYQGPRVAGLGQSFTDAMAKINGSTSAQDFGSARGIFESLAAQANALKPNAIKAGTVGTSDVTARDLMANNVNIDMLRDTDLSPYMNPMTDAVENRALSALDKSRVQALASNSSAATKAGAFGGSRHGIIDAVTNAETAQKAGDLSATLRRDAYDRATELAVGDITRGYASNAANEDRRLSTETGNEQRRLATETDNASRRLAADTTNVGNSMAAQQYNSQNILNTFLAKSGALGTAGSGVLSAAQGSQAARMQEFAGLLQGAGLDQANRQSFIDSDIEKFNEPRNRQIEDLNLRLSALGMSPYGKTENTQKTTQGGSSGTDWGQLGLGVFSLLLGLSDDDTKTDKQRVGKIPGTNLEAWAFRYKGDPKTYPKSVGVMASDVEKKMPEAVHRIGKRRVIDYGAVMAMAG